MTDFRAGLRVVSTDAPDVEMIGRILLEPADLDRGNVAPAYQKNHVLVAEALEREEAEFMVDMMETLLPRETVRGACRFGEGAAPIERPVAGEIV